MIKEQRQRLILDEIQRSGGMSLDHLATLTDTTYATVRRDVISLAEKGLLKRAHGAVYPSPSGRPLQQPQPDRSAWVIAQRALKLVSPGMCVGLTAGTTTTALAALLHTVDDLTIITDALPVLRGIGRRHHANTILVGGTRTNTGTHTGPVALAALRGLHLDVVFLHADAISKPDGLTHHDLGETVNRQAMHQSASISVALVEPHAWQQRRLCTVVRYDELSRVITPD